LNYSLKSFSLFDNYLILILILFLPFSQALTVNIGFPLKITELSLFSILFLIIWKNNIKINISIAENLIIILFIFSLVSVLVNIMWPYNYSLNTNYPTRLGYEGDSILKLIYVLLSICVFKISEKAFKINQYKYIKVFLFGAVIASVYSWYLFIFSIFDLSPFLLFGMEESPQRINLFVVDFIRCGTFKEGNFMALYLFVSIVLSLYLNKKWLAFFLTLTVITTASTIGLLVSLLLWIMYQLKNILTNVKHFVIGLFFMLAIVLSFVSLIENKDFQMLVTSKIDITSDNIDDNGAVSREDRMNSIVNAIQIGMHNPFFGIGLSNFALHYKFYNEQRGIGFERYGWKSIQNNVYAEIFSELGFSGLFIFLYFLYTLYKKSLHDQSSILKYGLIGILIYFNAFPSFTVLFIWVYFGLLNSLQRQHEEKIILQAKNI